MSESMAQRVATVLKRLVQVLGAGMVLALVRLYLQQRRLITEFMKRNPTAPHKHIDVGPIGVMSIIRNNWSRLYDWKLSESKELGKTFGVVTAFFDPRLILASTDPENVKYILKTRFNNFLKGDKTISVLSPLLGHGIFAVNHGPHAHDQGATWFYQRKTASKIFTRNVFQGCMYDTFSRNSQKIIARLEQTRGKEAVDMQTVFFKFTMDSIGSIGFGVDLRTLDSDGNTAFADAFDKAQKLTARRFLLPFVEILGPIYSAERELNRHIRTMDDFSYNVIRERLADPEVALKTDILSHFINSMRSSGDLPADPSATISKASRVFLRDVVMSFFIAGRDTTASALSFTFLLLSEHPQVQERLYEEIARELGEGHPDSIPAPTLEQLKNGFEYLNGVVNEALRLFPPVPTDGKEAVEEDVLPDGTWVPAGGKVNFETYAMGRSTHIWGEDISFKPERWVGPDKVNPTEWEFPTFQPGPRQCLGMALATFEAKVLTVELVRRFRFTLARGPVEPPYSPGITLTVNGGLPLVAVLRT